MNRNSKRIPAQRRLTTNVNQNMAGLRGKCTGVCQNCSSARFAAKVPVICNLQRRFTGK